MAARAQAVVVLVRTRNPLNMGAAARAMANFGFARLRVVQPYEAGFREARSAVGAAEVLRSAEEFGSVAEAVADCTLVVGTTALRGREPKVPIKTLEQGAKAIRRVRPGVALLFGSEKRGLSNEDLSHCNFVIHIPTEKKQPSMNLGQAVAVCLYEIARVNGGVRERKSRTSAGELERITEALGETLRASGYMKTGGKEKVRRLVRRMELGPEDATVLLGMLRQMLWKMRV
jgi:TrmH family RNA methyltransferase